MPHGSRDIRIKGWMGRADQTTKIRGMFVHPKQVDDIVKRFSGLARARLVVSGEMANDKMTLRVESDSNPDGLSARIKEAIRDVTEPVVWWRLSQLAACPTMARSLRMPAAIPRVFRPLGRLTVSGES